MFDNGNLRTETATHLPFAPSRGRAKNFFNLWWPPSSWYAQRPFKIVKRWRWVAQESRSHFGHRPAMDEECYLTARREGVTTTVWSCTRRPSKASDGSWPPLRSREGQMVRRYFQVLWLTTYPHKTSSCPAPPVLCHSESFIGRPMMRYVSLRTSLPMPA